MRRLTREERAQLPARYLAGESSGALAKSLSVTDVAILNHLKKMGVDRRDPSLARREYPLWDAAFSTRTPEAMYWIGFLMADGCVHDESKVTVGLARRDRRHLEKLRSYLRTDSRPIQYVPQNRSHVFKIHSRRIVSDLAHYGITPRKSLTAHAQNGADSHPAFWLGVLDGDGSIGTSKGRLRARFYGTPTLMRQLTRFLVVLGVQGRGRNLHLKVHVRRDGLGEVGLLGARAKNLLQLLYESSPVWLDRKKARAVKLARLIVPTAPPSRAKRIA
jgi:hypothetical protein